MSIFKRLQTDPVEDEPTKYHNLIVMDSSALIDGRIAELADSGFLEATFVVPGFVLDEMQMLADGKDSMKRERARYGMDIVRRLKDSKYCDVKLSNREYESTPQVDSKLMALCLDINAKLCTNDYNLNKVADIRDVTVLNINDLTKSLRTMALPGERKTITIVQKGSVRKQGVGYTDDGTMIVVEDAQKYMKKAVTVEVEKMLQTDAGKMIFAKLVPGTGKPESRASSKKDAKPKRKPAAKKQSSARSSTKKSPARGGKKPQATKKPATQTKKKPKRRLNEKEKLENRLLDTIANQE